MGIMKRKYVSPQTECISFITDNILEELHFGSSPKEGDQQLSKKNNLNGPFFDFEDEEDDDDRD